MKTPLPVRLIAITKPVSEEFRAVGDRGEIEYGDANDLIMYCARVSNPENQENFDTGEKLLRYCIKKKHWSIFDMADMVMEFNTTRDIGRQVLRHGSFKFQEFSQRYADPTQLGFVIRETRMQDVTNRQNSIELDKYDADPEFKKDIDAVWKKAQQEVAELALARYKWAIENGIAKEQARAVLPEGLTMSRMYLKGSVRSWFHYSTVRMDKSTQKEHRLLAEAAWEILKENFPFVKDIEIDLALT